MINASVIYYIVERRPGLIWNFKIIA